MGEEPDEPNFEERAALGQLIRAGRVMHMWTKEEAAERAGVNRLTFAGAERGDTKRTDTLAKIIRVLAPKTGGDWKRFLEEGLDETNGHVGEIDDDSLARRLTDGARQVADDAAELVRRWRATG